MFSDVDDGEEVGNELCSSFLTEKEEHARPPLSRPPPPSQYPAPWHRPGATFVGQAASVFCCSDYSIKKETKDFSPSRRHVRLLFLDVVILRRPAGITFVGRAASLAAVVVPKEEREEETSSSSSSSSSPKRVDC